MCSDRIHSIGISSHLSAHISRSLFSLLLALSLTPTLSLSLSLSDPLPPPTKRLHANETNTGFFYAFDDNNLFGQYGESEFQLSSFDPFVRSTDGGATWFSAGDYNCNMNLKASAYASTPCNIRILFKMVVVMPTASKGA